MIITVEKLKQLIDCGNATDEQITAKLEAIEAVIRAYTNNRFQVRTVRFVGYSEGANVHDDYGVMRHIEVGDTVQITGSDVNDGLYVVVAVDDDHIQLDVDLFDTDYNMVTKVQYPADVVQCAVDLYKWKSTMGDKVGVKSETLSRHSVAYEDSATLFMGYPVGILNGLALHKKARC